MTAAVGVCETASPPFGNKLGPPVRSGHGVPLKEAEREEGDKPLKVECDI